MFVTISELNDVEATALRYFRLWYAGTCSQQIVEKNFTISLGYAHGYKAFRSFGTMCELLLERGRRDLVKHPVTSDWVGLGERCFCQLISNSIYSDRDDAMLISFFLVSPEVAPILFNLAQVSGLAIKRLNHS